MLELVVGLSADFIVSLEELSSDRLKSLRGNNLDLASDLHLSDVRVVEFGVEHELLELVEHRTERVLDRGRGLSVLPLDQRLLVDRVDDVLNCALCDRRQLVVHLLGVELGLVSVLLRQLILHRREELSLFVDEGFKAHARVALTLLLEGLRDGSVK